MSEFDENVQALVDAYDDVCERLIELGEPETAKVVRILKRGFVSQLRHATQLGEVSAEFRAIAKKSLNAAESALRAER
ncbi:hypothetical protein [Nocardia asiatica]|uniref:hypothetical protein n=1 Tax=Nocardia asiatica TaxID=209252 RepID=UPI0002F5FABE|nr:hypothetical protein [Nocardia asiatica]